MRHPSRHPRPGLTLVQLLVILALLAFLLGLLLPAVARMRAAAERAQTMNNLKQLALALHNSYDTFKRMPPIVGVFPDNATAYGTLHFYLLPFIEQDNLYRNAQGYVWNKNTWSEIVPVFTNPNDPTVPAGYRHEGWLATTNYAGNWMVFKNTGARLTDITDGTSNTLAYAERYQLCNGTPTGWGYSSLYYSAPMFGYYTYGKFQQQPSQQECDPARPQALEPAGIKVALMDGSVRLVSNTVSPRTWWLVTDPADGEPLPSDWN
jgi:type II secretory pathway pseudopilin PulG